MTTPEPALDDIRREIDAIDDGILDLLVQRLTASQKVRNQKSRVGTLAASPIRPAREAAIMRRLLARGGKSIPPAYLVRLWRVILTFSTLAQAPVTIHVSGRLGQARRLDLRDHFGVMPVMEHASEAEALMQVTASIGDLCVVETGSNWADAFMAGHAGQARIIGVLPLLRTKPAPDLLIFGQAQALETGNDQSIVLDSFSPASLWQVKSGTHAVTCFPGFLAESQNLAGRFPSPIEVAP